MEAIPWEVNKTPFTDGYVAGFLDGDGSIVATLERRPERRRFPYRIRLKINFTQHKRHRKMLVMLQEYLGDVGSLRDVTGHNLAELVIQKRSEVKAVLLRVMPHLILKVRQARKMTDIIALYEKAKVNVRSSLSEKEFRRIVAIVREIRKLNSNTGGKQTV